MQARQAPDGGVTQELQADLPGARPARSWRGAWHRTQDRDTELREQHWQHHEAFLKGLVFRSH